MLRQSRFAPREAAFFFSGLHKNRIFDYFLGKFVCVENKMVKISAVIFTFFLQCVTNLPIIWLHISEAWRNTESGVKACRLGAAFRLWLHSLV
jgi:hypothetical protein